MWAALRNDEGGILIFDRYMRGSSVMLSGG